MPERRKVIELSRRYKEGGLTWDQLVAALRAFPWKPDPILDSKPDPGEAPGDLDASMERLMALDTEDTVDDLSHARSAGYLTDQEFQRLAEIAFERGA